MTWVGQGQTQSHNIYGFLLFVTWKVCSSVNFGELRHVFVSFIKHHRSSRWICRAKCLHEPTFSGFFQKLLFSNLELSKRVGVWKHITITYLWYLVHSIDVLCFKDVNYLYRTSIHFCIFMYHGRYIMHILLFSVCTNGRLRYCCCWPMAAHSTTRLPEGDIYCCRLCSLLPHRFIYGCRGRHVFTLARFNHEDHWPLYPTIKI